jgi:hypothetical protein
MHRWIAKLLVLVMFAPVFGPLALASAPQKQAAHCVRQPAKPAMQCHGMAMPPEPPSSGASFGSVEQCCPNHDCCRVMAAPQWAQPQSRSLSHRSVPSGPLPSSPDALFTPLNPVDNDSARAPPRS